MPRKVMLNKSHSATLTMIHTLSWLLLCGCLHALTMTAKGGTLHGLQQGLDLNDAVNPGACILWNWNGTGDDEMVMIDAVKHRLITMVTDPPYLWAFGPVATRATGLQWPFFVNRCDVNSDQKDDLVVLDGVRFRVWLFKSRTTVGEVPADIEGVLPLPPATAIRAVWVGDLERDGHPDLLVHSGQGRALWLVFDFATALPEARQITQISSVKNACIHPWDPAERPGLILSGVDTGSQVQGNTQIYRVAADRSLSLVEEIPGEGAPADLDGQFPPEFVDFSEKNATGMGSIRTKSGEIWSTAMEFPIPGSSYPGFYYPETVSDAADFDGDGREEIVFASVGSSEIFALQTNGAPNLASISPLPSVSAPVWKLSNVQSTTSTQAHLTIFSSTVVYDALGNPVTLAGFGIRAWLMRDAFSSSLTATYPLGPQRIADRLAVSDFNGDSLPDIGVLHKTEGQFSVYEGPTWDASQAGRPKLNGDFKDDSCVVADFTGDQIPDVLLPKARKISILKTQRLPGSTPDLSFSVSANQPFEQSYTSNGAPDRVFGAADFDQDGDADPLIFDPYNETLAWAENSGTGTITSLRNIALAGRRWRYEQSVQTGHYEWITQDEVLILDADDDGDPDIITLPSALGNQLALHRNHGGQFSVETLVPTSVWQDGWPWGAPSHILAGHFIASSSPIQLAMFGPRADISNFSSGIIILHGSQGNMTAGPVHPLPISKAVAVCDFDGDGLDDILTAGTCGNDGMGNLSGDTAIHFHRSLGDGRFAAPQIIAYPLGFVSQLVVADFTGDGQPDLVAASRETGSVELFKHEEVPVYPNYSEWSANFHSIDSDPMADPDADGLSNLLEFARGTPPDSAEISSPMIPAAPVNVAIICPGDFYGSAVHPRPRLAGGNSVDVTLEISFDMIEWMPLWFLKPAITFDPEYPQWDTLRWHLPSYAETAFYRFCVVHRHSGN